MDKTDAWAILVHFPTNRSGHPPGFGYKAHRMAG
jgi:hypothetical protein